ncbi:hypothetical protein PPN99_01650 [Proteus mirabilis]|uniref:hypothetical protein n=1 Tax=Proteus mirabilis TaxID=584 RepID=UPI00234BB489|nr:hypothetical protein [Proteus mirabilis]MDC5907439.1 hypothetical protein [Proteus mirabilis]
MLPLYLQFYPLNWLAVDVIDVVICSLRAWRVVLAAHFVVSSAFDFLTWISCTVLIASCFSGAKEDLVVSDSAFDTEKLPAETDTFLLFPCRAASLPSVLSFKLAGYKRCVDVIDVVIVGRLVCTCADWLIEGMARGFSSGSLASCFSGAKEDIVVSDSVFDTETLAP